MDSAATPVDPTDGVTGEIQMTPEDCQKLHRDTEITSPGPFCNATWDNILCWPPTAAGTTTSQQCPTLKGVDPSKLVFKVCLPSGLWKGKTLNDAPSEAGWTNYTTCYTDEMRKIIAKLYAGSQADAEQKILIARNTRILELTGLSLSLATLFISLFIFFHFRSLKNNRTKIHRNLLVAMVIQVLVRLVLYLDQVISRGGIGEDAPIGSASQGIDNTPFVCEAFYVLLEYARTAMFMWMFIEGLYLNTMISVTVFSPKFYDKFYYATGWGVPIIMTAIWAVFTGLNYGEISCWWNYNLTTHYWILEGPRIAVMMLNVAFLVNIIIVLVTKMRQSNSSEALQAR